MKRLALIPLLATAAFAAHAQIHLDNARGREAATAVGAVAGAVTGNNLANRDRWQQPVPMSREVTTCRDVEDVPSRPVGYQVTYDYHGQQYTTLMQDDPRRFVPVRVSVDLVGR